MTTLDLQFSSARRRALFTAVSSLCSEAGFESAEKAVLETLTEMLGSCISEIGRSCRAFCELAGRTEVVVGDVVMSLVEMGMSTDSISSYAKRTNRTALPPMTAASQTNTPKILQAGQKRPHPSYIPDYLPPFPDPHAYIRTPTYKQPVTEYEAIREKAASQKRDVERALTRFIAKTGDTHKLFCDDTNMYPLIACKPMPHPYMPALLPKDQVFDEEEPTKESPTKRGRTDIPMTEDEGQSSRIKEEFDLDAIDNPYLRPIKMPRKKRR